MAKRRRHRWIRKLDLMVDERLCARCGVIGRLSVPGNGTQVVPTGGVKCTG